MKDLAPEGFDGWVALTPLTPEALAYLCDVWHVTSVEEINLTMAECIEMNAKANPDAWPWCVEITEAYKHLRKDGDA